MLKRCHAKAVHPCRLSLKVRPLLQVHRHIERLTSEQFKPEDHVFALTKFASNVNGKGVEKVVDGSAEVNDVTEEEGERFNAFLFTKSGQFEPLRINFGGKRQ